jgi:hypothetical protein
MPAKPRAQSTMAMLGAASHGQGCAPLDPRKVLTAIGEAVYDWDLARPRAITRPTRRRCCAVPRRRSRARSARLAAPSSSTTRPRRAIPAGVRGLAQPRDDRGPEFPPHRLRGPAGGGGAVACRRVPGGAHAYPDRRPPRQRRRDPASIRARRSHASGRCAHARTRRGPPRRPWGMGVDYLQGRHCGPPVLAGDEGKQAARNAA